MAPAASLVCGDEVVIITTVSPSPTTAALVVTTANSGTVLGSDRASDDKDGEVLGEDNRIIPRISRGQGLVTKVQQLPQTSLK
jgi:hypothetical protein